MRVVYVFAFCFVALLVAMPAPKGKVTRLDLEGIHNCCGACTKSIKKAVAQVAGVKSDSAKAKESSMVVEGDFVATEVIDALLNAGFHVQVKK